MSNAEFWRNLVEAQVKECLQSCGNVSIFIGAGVSCSCGIPEWKTLAQQIVEATWKGPISGAAVQHIREWEPLLSVRLAKKKLKQKFNALLHEILYRSDPKPSPTVSTLAETTHVREFCCYNYDDMLEAGFDLAKRKCLPIINGDEIPETHGPEAIIYHPHGFLPRQLTQADLERPIILSEADYHGLYGDPYSWPNLIQLRLLLCSNILFVGFSFRDPNVVRLLDIVSSLKVPYKKWVLMQDPSADALKNKAISSQEAEMLSAVEGTLLVERGVTPYYYADHDEVPGILKKLGL